MQPGESSSSMLPFISPSAGKGSGVGGQEARARPTGQGSEVLARDVLDSLKELLHKLEGGAVQGAVTETSQDRPRVMEESALGFPPPSPVQVT